MSENLKKLSLKNTIEKYCPNNDEDDLATTKLKNSIQQFDVKQQLNENVRKFKSLNFEVQNTVTQGISYTVIKRNVNTSIDILGGTYKYFKIHTIGVLYPLRLVFRYKNHQSKAMHFMYSRFSSKPNEENCEREVTGPNIVIINEPEDVKLEKDAIFIKVQSEMDCIAFIRFVSPR